MKRILALSVITMAMAFSSAASQAPVPPSQPYKAATTAREKLAREIYAELVGINTMDSVGSTTRAARAMAKRFIAAGFPAADVKVLIPAEDSTKGNLVVRYRATGASTRKPLLLLAHIDVVAALRSDWTRDPFTLGEENGFFYGRGSADDKAMASMFVANMIQDKAEGWRPDRDIILALTAAEEGGDNNGVEWLIREHLPLISAEYAINEGGGGALMLKDGKIIPLFNGIQAAEKVPENFTLTVRNKGGHSSVPQPVNAIYSLANALGRLSRFTFPVALNPVSRQFFQEGSKVTPEPAASAMAAIAANPLDSAAAAVLSKDPLMASILRTSCVATKLAAGHANNALPQTATANVNCRIVPTSSTEETRAILTRIFDDTSVVISFTTREREKFPKSTEAVVPEVLAATTDITHSMFGNIPVLQVMSTGATDGRFLRAVGVPTFGISGIFSFPGENNAHGRDEKLRTQSYYDGLSFLDKLVHKLSGG
jgi:acetylornithine deacetylase/succinyl-diaminopimelate desuccinylase-like protein